MSDKTERQADNVIEEFTVKINNPPGAGYSAYPTPGFVRFEAYAAADMVEMKPGERAPDHTRVIWAVTLLWKDGQGCYKVAYKSDGIPYSDEVYLCAGNKVLADYLEKRNTGQ